jgi:Ras GTPase-activating protein-binding protein 1
MLQLIHEKIMSLGLQQVHTKIRQVDCHPTIANDTGKSIVIQVTGELSVAGQPMRPFVQTFVLAHESPRKYFIHNDIFRYQVYDEDYTSEPEGEESLVPEEQEIVAVDHPISREATPYGNQEEDVPLSDNNVQKISPLPVVANEVPSISWSDQQPQPQYEGKDL